MIQQPNSDEKYILNGFLFDYAILALIAFGAWYAIGWEFYEVFPGLLLLHLFASFQTVDAKELAGNLFFGDFIEEVDPGWKLVPFLSSKLVRETALTLQRQFPAEPEDIDKTGSDVPAKGKVFPIRVTHAQKDNSGDPLDKRLTTETTVVGRFRIKKGEFKKFYTNIGSMEEAIRQIRDAIEGEIKIKFASKTVADTLLELSQINKDLTAKITELVESWGMEVLEIRIVEVGLNHNVNKEMSNVVQSEFKKRSTILNAQAEKIKLTLEGEGVADARKNFLNAEARGRAAYLLAEKEGFEALKALATDDAGKFVQAMQVLKEGFAKGNSTFFDSNIFLNAVATVESVVAKIKGAS